MGVIGYLFAQNVNAARRENAQITSALARLQHAQGRDAVHVATVTARVDGLQARVEALERRRKPSIISVDNPKDSDEET